MVINGTKISRRFLAAIRAATNWSRCSILSDSLQLLVTIVAYTTNLEARYKKFQFFYQKTIIGLKLASCKTYRKSDVATNPD